MKTHFAFLLGLAMLASSGVRAAIVCEGKTSFQDNFKLTLSEDQSARVEVRNEDGGLEFEQNFEKTASAWDGHALGMITAPGLSVLYANHYGCIRNAEITVNIRGGGVGFETIKVRTCRGGSTPDRLCIGS